VLFVSIYNCFLCPIMLLVAGLAFLLVFLVDRYTHTYTHTYIRTHTHTHTYTHTHTHRYLLLRRWRPMCMLDAKIARRLRQQGILAVAVHMGVTLRYIYSWPMDSAYLNDSGVYEKVDKLPPVNLLEVGLQPWMGAGQRAVLPAYRITMLCVTAVCLYSWVLDPLLTAVRRLFCRYHSPIFPLSHIPLAS
jgi:hypothetical protein